MKNISFLRNGKEFKPTKKQLKIVLDDYALMLVKKMKENQALKTRWEKLKDFIDTFKEQNIDEANLAWKILDKMQELEK